MIVQTKKTYGIELDQYLVEIPIDLEMIQFLKGITVSMTTGVALFEIIFIFYLINNSFETYLHIYIFLYIFIQIDETKFSK